MMLSVNKYIKQLVCCYLCFSADLFAASNFNLGTGIFDITGPAAGNAMLGYADTKQQTTGIHQRSRSRAFIMQSQASGKRIVFVSADLASIYQSVKIEVIKRLTPLYGKLYTHDNVMLTASHTHVAAGGFSHYMLYELASASGTSKLGGYSSENFNIIVDGIVRSISRAHNNLAPGSLALAQGELEGATKNRSIAAYNNNVDSDQYSSATNNTMSVLKFIQAPSREIGMINWFSIHPTSFSKKFTLISGDNKGYAQYKFGKLKGTNFSSETTFVPAFANSDEGDVVPSEGNAYSSKGFQGESDEYLNTERSGQRQFEKGLMLYNSEGLKLNGRIDYRHRWANMNNYQVHEPYTATGPQELCKAARGFSFAAGGENGPTNTPGLSEGMTVRNTNIQVAQKAFSQSPFGEIVSQTLSSSNLAQAMPCQYPKPVLMSTGEWNWVPTTLPFQLFIVGELAIIGVPAEATTMAGRRIRADVLKELHHDGITKVIIAGLANTYSGYVTTKEEYQLQHYEGASTEFGQYTLAAFRQEFSALASAISNNQVVVDDKQPRDRVNEYRSERAAVVFDNKPGQEQFGHVITNAKASYHSGDEVKVTFRGAHPKNNPKTQGSFLEVQHKVGWKWKTVAYDWDWNTTYEWHREGFANSTVDVSWKIPENVEVGTYRVVHHGDWKSGWSGKVEPYTGTSRRFEVF